MGRSNQGRRNLGALKPYEASIKITGPLVGQIIKQAHEPPDETEIKTFKRVHEEKKMND